jgi:hypothetical protein
LIKEFYVNGLFNERNIRIPFEGPTKIIVAENGYGKTTILNLIYALVSGDISKLRRVDFSSIGIQFSDKTNVHFEKSEFDADLDFIRGHHFFEHLESKLGENFILELIDDVRKYPPQLMEKSLLFRQAMSSINIPPSILRDYLREIRSNRSNKRINSKTEDKLNIIKVHLPLKTLYLPTYRRVEEDIKAFSSGNDETSFRNGTINFGMSDVAKNIEQITSEILSSSVEWFSKINGQMLAQLVNGFSVTDEMKRSISRPKAVEIVLERIGKNISQQHKDQILSLVNSGEIQRGHDPLVYFVSNLLKVYEQQQENDSAIQSFTSVSNK